MSELYRPMIGNKVYTDIGKAKGSAEAVTQFNRDLAQYEQAVALQKLANNTSQPNYHIDTTDFTKVNYYHFNPNNPNHHKYIKLANKIDRFENTYTPFLLLVICITLFALFICICIDTPIVPILIGTLIASIIGLIYISSKAKKLSLELENQVKKNIKRK